MAINLTIEQAQHIVDEWVNTKGVRYFNELTNMAILTEEVGEVARLIARQYGEQAFKESDRDRDLGDELADVLFVVICLANQTGVNLTDALIKNLEKKTKRDTDRHRNNENLPELFSGVVLVQPGVRHSRFGRAGRQNQKKGQRE